MDFPQKHNDLRHNLLNGGQSILGCLKEIEKELDRMSQTVKAYQRGLDMSDLKELIKKHEGLRLKPYRCSAGKLTIGYGRNLDDVGITEYEAEIMLDRDIAQAKQNLFVVFGDLIKSFSKNRYNALVDMMFNLGLPRFRGFKKMIKAIQKGDWDAASREAIDSKWADQVKLRAIENAMFLKEG